MFNLCILRTTENLKINKYYLNIPILVLKDAAASVSLVAASFEASASMFEADASRKKEHKENLALAQF